MIFRFTAGLSVEKKMGLRLFSMQALTPYNKESVPGRGHPAASRESQGHPCWATARRCGRTARHPPPWIPASWPVSESTQNTALCPAAILGVPSPSTKAGFPSRSNTSKVRGTRASASSTQLRLKKTVSSAGRVVRPQPLRKERMRGFRILRPHVSRSESVAS